MTRPLTRFERAILDAFERRPDGTYTVDELAAFAFPNLPKVENWQRRRVLSAVHRVISFVRWDAWAPNRELMQPDFVFFNPSSTRSCAEALTRRKISLRPVLLSALVADLRKPARPGLAASSAGHPTVEAAMATPKAASPSASPRVA